MVQKGDYQETLFRPGDCAVESRNFLKYLKKFMVGRRVSNLLQKIHFSLNFQLVSLNSIFLGDCLGTTFILSKNIFEDNKNGLAVN